METKIKSSSPEPLSPLVDISEVSRVANDAEAPDIVVVFELGHGQYASARRHLDHLIDAHGLSAHVHFEDQI